MTIYELIYKEERWSRSEPKILGLYSSEENARTAGERAYKKITRAYKKITGEKEFYWTEEYVDTVFFQGGHATSMLKIVPVEVDSVLM